MRRTRAEIEAHWKEQAEQRAAEKAQRERKEAENRAHRVKVGSVSRIMLYKRLSADTCEAFDELCQLIKAGGEDFEPSEGWHWIHDQLPKYVGDELIKFIHAYERAGGTVFDYRASSRRWMREHGIPTPA